MSLIEEKKVLQGTSPIYNLLPDMLSSLSSEASLPPEHFQAIMRHLLTFIAKEKQVDSLVEKLCLRFAATQASKLQPLLLDRFGPVNVGLLHVIQHPHSQTATAGLTVTGMYCQAGHRLIYKAACSGLACAIFGTEAVPLLC